MTKEAADYNGTVVVIPTRNRAAIAMNAIRSVLDQPVADVSVIVSDNSTSESDREMLANFCATEANPRLRYVRPSQSLPMSAHWEWAIQQALPYAASHFIYLTDRMMFRSRVLKEVLDIARLYPDKIISYNHDRIIDSARPIRIEQYPGTGKLLEVQTLRLSYLFARACFSHCLPRMLNCIVPRTTLERIHQRFGNVFASISPDFIFCCRSLELEDSILFYDKSPLFHYALDRSNGASVSRGEMTADNADFTANLPVDNSIRNYATPIPPLITAVNAAFNEYLAFKRETGSSRFFEVDFQSYLRANAQEISGVTDPKLRAEMLSLLVAKGYRNEAPDCLPVKTSGSDGRRPSNSTAEGLKSRFQTACTSAATKPGWLFLARTFGITPPAENGFEFGDLEEAIDYLKSISRGNFKQSRVTQELLLARELPINPAVSKE